ncbi:unconventional myosin heavy chain, partial [Reticulomyxa filosa]
QQQQHQHQQHQHQQQTVPANGLYTNGKVSQNEDMKERTRRRNSGGSGVMSKYIAEEGLSEPGSIRGGRDRDRNQDRDRDRDRDRDKEKDKEKDRERIVSDEQSKGGKSTNRSGEMDSEEFERMLSIKMDQARASVEIDSFQAIHGHEKKKRFSNHSGDHTPPQTPVSPRRSNSDPKRWVVCMCKFDSDSIAAEGTTTNPMMAPPRFAITQPLQAPGAVTLGMGNVPDSVVTSAGMNGGITNAAAAGSAPLIRMYPPLSAPSHTQLGNNVLNNNASTAMVSHYVLTNNPMPLPFVNSYGQHYLSHVVYTPAPFTFYATAPPTLPNASVPSVASAPTSAPPPRHLPPSRLQQPLHTASTVSANKLSQAPSAIVVMSNNNNNNNNINNNSNNNNNNNNNTNNNNINNNNINNNNINNNSNNLYGNTFSSIPLAAMARQQSVTSNSCSSLPRGRVNSLHNLSTLRRTSVRDFAHELPPFMSDNAKRKPDIGGLPPTKDLASVVSTSTWLTVPRE